MHTLLLLGWMALAHGLTPSAATPAATGVVTAADGREVAGVTVVLGHLEDRSTRRLAVTDAGGRFRIDGVLPGTYLVHIEHRDYRPLRDVHVQTPSGMVLHVALISR